MLNRQQWAQLLTDSYKQLEDMLAQRQCKLANTEGNKYRVVEAVQKSFGGKEPENPTPQDIATRMFSFVLSDVNGLINGTGGGQLFWEKKPAKLIAWEQSRITKPHLPEKKERRVSSESSEQRRENIIQLERIYDGLPYVSPRAATLRTYINNVKEDSSTSSAEALKVCRKFLATQDVRVALRDLQALLANNITLIEYLDSKQPAKSSGVLDVSEFLGGR